MFYKFMSGADALATFDKAVIAGSVKFSPALGFNDPFEFKFRTIAPSREEFDAWHRAHEPGKSAEELSNAWQSFFGPAADWNTGVVPRMTLLSSNYVLCLARRFDSHLMWGHYASDHRGFAVCYRPGVIAALADHPDFAGADDVLYHDDVPELRWFSAAYRESAARVLVTKSRESAYEGEHRALMTGAPGQKALYPLVDPALIAGVILGAKAPGALIDKALAHRKTRPDRMVSQIEAVPGTYELRTRPMVEGVRTMSGFL